MRIECFLEGITGLAMREALGYAAPPLLRRATHASHGDYQVNGVLSLAKQLNQPARPLAERVALAIQSQPVIAQAVVAGPGFVNLHLSPTWLARQLDAALVDAARDGVPLVAHAERVVVDFSSPNIAKQMHVGHLRSTILGDAIVRILRFLGHTVVGDNHLGDWGTQFGLLIAGMRHFGNAEVLRTEPLVELERIYKMASERAENDNAFAAEARAELAKLQNGDSANTALWQQFVDITKQDLHKIYDRLDVSFDTWYGESFYRSMLSDVVKLLLDHKLARRDHGASCIFFQEIPNVAESLREQKEPLIIQKADGAFLYSTTDLATVQYRRETIGAQRIIYLTDMRQKLHFQQIFAVAELLGWDDVRLEHYGFGSVLGTDGKPLRTREASRNATPLLSLLDEAEARALLRLREALAEGRIDVAAEELPRVARAVGIGAVKYADLRQNRTSDYRFDFDKMISFQGNAGPYLQYAYARAQSIFQRGGVDPAELRGPIGLNTEEEQAVGRVLVRFGEVLHQTAETGLPHLVADHLYELARAYSAFLEACPILKADETTRRSRLSLVALAARQLRRGLSLLGIHVVARM